MAAKSARLLPTNVHPPQTQIQTQTQTNPNQTQRKKRKKGIEFWTKPNKTHKGKAKSLATTWPNPTTIEIVCSLRISLYLSHLFFFLSISALFFYSNALCNLFSASTPNKKLKFSSPLCISISITEFSDLYLHLSR